MKMTRDNINLIELLSLVFFYSSTTTSTTTTTAYTPAPTVQQCTAGGVLGDINNCGICGRKCNGNTACTGGVCACSQGALLGTTR